MSSVQISPSVIGFVLFAAFIAYKLWNEKGKTKKPSDAEPWSFGDEWKNSEESINLEEWEEIVTIPEGYSRIYDQAVPIMRRETIDLNELQTLLTQNQIVSKIAPSKKISTTPSAGLFVEKKFILEAKRILDI